MGADRPTRRARYETRSADQKSRVWDAISRPGEQGTGCDQPTRNVSYCMSAVEQRQGALTSADHRFSMRVNVGPDGEDTGQRSHSPPSIAHPVLIPSPHRAACKIGLSRRDVHGGCP